MTPQQRLDASWSAFVLTGDAIAATWTPAGGSPVPGSVIFDAPGQDVFGSVVAINRVATYRVSQWPTVGQGDTITIDGQAYRCEAPMPIDDGLVARVELVKA